MDKRMESRIISTLIYISILVILIGTGGIMADYADAGCDGCSSSAYPAPPYPPPVTATFLPTNTPILTNTPLPTLTPESSATYQPTNPPDPTSTPTVQPTEESTHEPTSTNTATVPALPTQTETPSKSPTATGTPTVPPEATETTVPLPTAKPNPTSTHVISYVSVKWSDSKQPNPPTQSGTLRLYDTSDNLVWMHRLQSGESFLGCTEIVMDSNITVYATWDDQRIHLVGTQDDTIQLSVGGCSLIEIG